MPRYTLYAYVDGSDLDEVANDIEERLLERAIGWAPTYEGPVLFRLTTSGQGLGLYTDTPIDLGTVIEITHLEGLGPTGYEGQRGRVTGMGARASERRAARIHRGPGGVKSIPRAYGPKSQRGNHRMISGNTMQRPRPMICSTLNYPIPR